VVAGWSTARFAVLQPAIYVFLWAALSDGRAPANICVDACLTLRNAYGQLGVRAELLPATVAIRKKNGTGALYGSLTPSWTGTSGNGHCALVLPDSERFVDPTRHGPDGRQGGHVDPR
jgi:hypothetical protein